MPGNFLDSGELESLIDAENAYYAASPAPGPRAAEPQGHGGSSHGSGRGRKRGGFFGELFD